MGTAYILLAAGADDKGKLAGAVMMAQLLKTAEAIASYYRANRNLQDAALVQRHVVNQLRAIRLPGYAPPPRAETTSERHSKSTAPTRTPPARPGQPSPNQLGDRPRTGAQPDRTRDGTRDSARDKGGRDDGRGR